MSHIVKGAAGLAATLLFAGAAQAGCGSSLYCGQVANSHGTSTLPPLSSYFSGGAASTGSSYATSYASSASSYSSSSTYTMSAAEASARYGSGSISPTYTSDYAGGDVEMYGFSGSVATAPGLSAGESLSPVNCPVNVVNPGEGRVLGCYSVVRHTPAPIANTTYYRVVRPVIYVRYPVPVPVPYYAGCTVTSYNYSRYGDWGRYGYGYGHNAGHFGGRRCG